MRKQTMHKMAGMDKDTPLAQRSQDTYWEAHNIKLINNGATRAATTHEGFDTVFTLPTEVVVKNSGSGHVLVYDDPLTGESTQTEVINTFEINNVPIQSDFNVVGVTEMDDDIYMIGVSSGLMTIICRYNLKDDGITTFEVLFAGFLGMKHDTRITLVGNFETSNIKKLYWVDGYNQLRHLNVANNYALNANLSNINSAGGTEFSDITLSSYTSGPGQRAGKVQYAYTLYTLNGKESALSPLSGLFDVVDPSTFQGEAPYTDTSSLQVKVTLALNILELDNTYDYIRVYAIKFTSPNVEPSVRVLLDANVTSYSNFGFFDDGTQSLGDITLAELFNKSQAVLIPQHLVSNRSKLFIANYANDKVSVDMDTRAFKYPHRGTATAIYEDHNSTGSKTLHNPNSITYDLVSKNHTCWNDREGFQYMYGSSSFGATGPNVELEIMLVDSDIKTESGSETFLDFPITPNEVPPGDPVFTFNATNAMLESPGETSIGPLTDTTAQTATIGDAYEVSSAGNADINGTGTTSLYEDGDYIQVIYSDVAMKQGYQTVKLQERTTYNVIPVTKSFKRGENYRFGVEFYDKFGNVTDVNWVCDYRFPYTESLDKLYVAKLTIKKSARETLVNNDIVSYKTVAVQRTIRDRSIITQGLINPLFIHTKQGKTDENTLRPYHTMKDYTSTPGASMANDYDQGVDYDARNYKFDWNGAGTCTGTTKEKSNNLEAQHEHVYFISPELVFGEPLSNGASIRPLGGAKLNVESSSSHMQYAKELHPDAPKTMYEGIQFNDRYMDGGVGNSETGSFYSGFNKVYDEFKIPDAKLLSGGIPRKHLDDVEAEDSMAVIDTGESKKIDGKVIQSGVRMSYTGTSYIDCTDRRFPYGLHTDYTSFGYLRFKDERWCDQRARATAKPTYRDIMDVPMNADRYAMIVELTVDLPQQYGGYTYAERQRNQYIQVGTLAPLTEDAMSIALGDTYLTDFKFLRNSSEKDGKANRYHFTDEWVSVKLESNLNLSTRYDLMDDDFNGIISSGNFSVAIPDKPQDYIIMNHIAEMHKYNPVYHIPNATLPRFAKPESVVYEDKYPTTIWASNNKILNEKTDSWIKFSVHDTLTLPTEYGEISGLYIVNDVLTSSQRSGMATISVDPRVQVTADDGGAVGLGSGATLADYKYLTTTSGTIHKWSMVRSPIGNMYFDYNNRSVNILGSPEQEVSTTSGINKDLWDYIDANPQLEFNTNKLGNLVSFHFDNRSDNEYLTFQGKDRMTVSFNNILTVPVSFHDFSPDIYFSYKGFMHNVDKGDVKRITLGKYTNNGVKQDVSITVLNSESAQLIKRFDNIEVDSSVLFDTIECSNSYQTTGIKDFTAKRSVLRKRMVLPRAAQRKRLRDDHLYVKLSYTNEAPINFEYLSLAYDISKTYYIES